MVTDMIYWARGYKECHGLCAVPQEWRGILRFANDWALGGLRQGWLLGCRRPITVLVNLESETACYEI